MNESTLTMLRDGVPIFTSYGNWLHPLFELEDYLAEHPVQPEHLVLQDKIIGKAAALLINRLEFRTVKVGILSRPGEVVLKSHGIDYTYGQIVTWQDTYRKLALNYDRLPEIRKGGHV
ncbi:MAG: hypothetical protein ETSY1_21175 [Candidatus Entotheonella factor]|uniref:DUF1893 domain-containing protein n=1 Tax=Entotheonella factor TaxID=1429438 RepID=W4LKH7_ENTF1|nr:MAG: hypothetical protein ETSY1_21175 [Candidatus Entotheonella factor]